MGILYNPPCGHDENFAFPLYFHYSLIANGCWPTDGDEGSIWFRLRDKLYTLWNWFAISSMALLAVCESVFFFSHIKDITKAVESLSATMTAVMILIRFIHMRYAMRRVKHLLGIFADKIWIKRKTHPQIYDRCIKNTNPIFYISLALWATFLIYNILPIANILTTDQTLESTDKTMPYLMLFPYDHQRPLAYILTYIVTFYAGLVIVIQFYAMDALLAMSVSFLSGQFEILHGKIMRLIPECHVEWLKCCRDDAEVGNENVRQLQGMYTKRLHELAAHHNDLISFSQVLETFVSFPLMVSFVTSTLLICFVGFQFLIGGSNSLSDFMRYFLYFLSVTGQLYVICNMGAMLISKSTDTAHYLFVCNWEGGIISTTSPLLLDPAKMELEELSIKLPLWKYINYYPTNTDFQHKLRFMIMRSHRPVQLTALKYAVLSLESFSRIISASMSYFALLKTILDKQS